MFAAAVASATTATATPFVTIICTSATTAGGVVARRAADASEAAGLAPPISRPRRHDSDSRLGATASRNPYEYLDAACAWQQPPTRRTNSPAADTTQEALSSRNGAPLQMPSRIGTSETDPAGHSPTYRRGVATASTAAAAAAASTHLTPARRLQLH